MSDSKRRWAIEAVVIVLSILLAFAIDAWWDERQETVQTERMLQSMAEDFRSNLTEAREVIERHRTRRELVTRLAGMDDAQIRALPADSFGVYYAALYDPRSFDPATATIDALVGSGDLDLVEDEELRLLLSRFLNVVRDSEEEEEWMQDVSRRIRERTTRHGGPWDARSRSGSDLFPALTADDLIRLRNDEELMGQVRLNLLYVGVYVSELEDVVAVSEQVVERLGENSR